MFSSRNGKKSHQINSNPLSFTWNLINQSDSIQSASGKIVENSLKTATNIERKKKPVI